MNAELNTDNSLIKLTNISKAFAGVKALNGIDLEIRRGKIYCLMGENGCGKSTLIKIISGVYSPDEGTIEVDGKIIKRMTPKEALKKGIEVIYQDFSVFPNLTVAENIAMNTEITEKRRLVNWKRIRQQAELALGRLGITLPLDETVERLSVANRQLIAISRAISHDARLLIMDEPTTALTKYEVDALFEVVKRLNESGISIIFVSHKMDEVMELSQEIVVMRNGEKVAGGNIADFTKEKIIYHMTGRELANASYELPEMTDSKTILEVEHITQKGGFLDISFQVKEHEIVGITGLLGSGRTALANALFGIHKIDSGRVLLNGKQIELGNVRTAVLNGIAYVPEDRLTEGLFLDQPINKNIAVTMLDQLSRGPGMIQQAAVRNMALQWIEKLHIKAASDELPIRSLSGGNQQKVVIAKWLALGPRILILNGPTVGVDVGAKTDIIEMIKSLAKEGMSIILVSDDVSEIIMCCNRIMIMKSGRISEELMIHDLTETELYSKIRAQEE